MSAGQPMAWSRRSRGLTLPSFDADERLNLRLRFGRAEASLELGPPQTTLFGWCRPDEDLAGQAALVIFRHHLDTKNSLAFTACHIERLSESRRHDA